MRAAGPAVAERSQSRHRLPPPPVSPLPSQPQPSPLPSQPLPSPPPPTSPQRHCCPTKVDPAPDRYQYHVRLPSTAANAAVHRVFPGQSIQAAIDGASPGDTILVEPGVYQETGNAQFGLRISTDNLRLIGKANKGQGETVRLVHYGTQETGVYAAPAACGPGGWSLVRSSVVQVRTASGTA